MCAIDAGWTQRELTKVKSEPANIRKGAAFELLGLNILSRHQRIVPTATGNPGYDGIALQVASTVRSLAFRMRCFSLAKTCSMGLRSGE